MSMVTAVSGFIEQVGSMIDQNTIITIPFSFKELAQTLVMASAAGFSYLIHQILPQLVT